MEENNDQKKPTNMRKENNEIDGNKKPEENNVNGNLQENESTVNGNKLENPINKSIKKPIDHRVAEPLRGPKKSNYKNNGNGIKNNKNGNKKKEANYKNGNKKTIKT